MTRTYIWDTGTRKGSVHMVQMRQEEVKKDIYGLVKKAHGFMIYKLAIRGKSDLYSF